jgi:hypothetical protein
MRHPDQGLRLWTSASAGTSTCLPADPTRPRTFGQMAHERIHSPSQQAYGRQVVIVPDFIGQNGQSIISGVQRRRASPDLGRMPKVADDRPFELFQRPRAPRIDDAFGGWMPAGADEHRDKRVRSLPGLPRLGGLGMLLDLSAFRVNQGLAVFLCERACMAGSQAAFDLRGLKPIFWLRRFPGQSVIEVP